MSAWGHDEIKAWTKQASALVQTNLKGMSCQKQELHHRAETEKGLNGVKMALKGLAEMKAAGESAVSACEQETKENEIDKGTKKQDVMTRPRRLQALTRLFPSSLLTRRV